MFLGPKTIEYHLRNVYRKLGVRSRRSSRTRWLRASASASETLSVAACGG